MAGAWDCHLPDNGRSLGGSTTDKRDYRHRSSECSGESVSNEYQSASGMPRGKRKRLPYGR